MKSSAENSKRGDNMKKLFEEISINSLTLKNRIIMPCLDSTFTGEGGTVNPRLINYFRRRAQGGVAFIMVGPASFDPAGIGYISDYRLDRDDILQGLAKLAGAIHKFDVPVGLQMYHGGRQADPDITGQELLAPSAIADPVRRIVPRALTIAQIEELIHGFGTYALKVKEAGFDAVEIHGSHGYLLSEFLSPFANQRTDRYGGTLENRARFPGEIIREVRENVGKDFPVIFRIAGDEHVPGGLTSEETSLIARIIQDAGADAINVSAGTYKTAEWIVPPMILPRGCNVPAAEAIKKKVSIPVIVAGRINSPEFAESILVQGKADLVAMGRPLVADPDLPEKAKQGRLDQIRRCIACDLCVDMLFKGEEIKCTVNPEVGFESDFVLSPAGIPKKVMVIGGGPAGMETARVAALRGHKVSIFEEHDRLGGMIEPAARASFKEEVKNIIEYYGAVLNKLEVDLHLGEKVTMEVVCEFKPDVVVVATGATPLVPDITGADLPNVVQAVDVLLDNETPRGKIAVLGGGSVGCEVASFLAETGEDVTVFEMLPYVAHGMPRLLGKMMKDKMIDLGISFMTSRKAVQIIENGLICKDADGREETHYCDRVVLAVGAVPENSLAESLKGSVPEIHVVGDCIKPRNAADAIQEGARAALSI
jgi:2,4-dienoyl-CoA reductase-like NADH-dependent reductase (Old Yellow Enzyme family)/thioredoxin reductase